MKNRHLRARLPEDEYNALKIAADVAGLTISEHVRNVILRDQQAFNQKQLLAEIDGKFAALSIPPASTSTDTGIEPLFAELLFLTRELAAERNAQLLGRVAHQVNTLYPNRKKF